MSTSKVIEKSKRHPMKGGFLKEDILKQIRFDEGRVRACAELWFDRALAACNSDPSMASEDEVLRSTYKHWVGYVDGQWAQHLHRWIPIGAPQHVRREMMKLMLGCSELTNKQKFKVRQPQRAARSKRPNTPYAECA